MEGKRTRGRKLQQIRTRHFRNAPLCVMCEAEGKVTLATELDHVLALSNGGTDNGLKQGLCHHHHLIKTAKDKGIAFIPKVTIGPDGWPTKTGGDG